MFGIKKGESVFSENLQIDNIVKICDNLMYGDYFEKGGDLKSREEIIEHIKNETAESLVDFYGLAHEDRIKQLVDREKIVFGYQTVGKNSIEDFLNSKENEYLKSKGYPIDGFQILGITIKAMSNLGMIKYNTESKAVDAQSFHREKHFLDMRGLSMAAQIVGEDPSILINGDESALTGFFSKMCETCDLYASQITEGKSKYQGMYSDIPEVNKDMQLLSEYVREYKKEMNEYAKLDPAYDRSNPNNPQEHFASMGYDGIRKKNTLGVKSPSGKVFDKTVNVAAFENAQNRELVLGVMPSDWLVIHEFIHLIEQSGFQRNNKMCSSKYSSHLRENEMFDEACVDYFAMLIYQERIKQGKSKIINSEPFTSSYSELFPVIGVLIDKMLPTLKHSKMVSIDSASIQGGFLEKLFGRGRSQESSDPLWTPSEWVSNIIGEETFSKLCLLCNDFISLRNANRDKRAFDKLVSQHPEVDSTLIILEGISTALDLDELVKTIINRDEGLEHIQLEDDVAWEDFVQCVQEIPVLVNEIENGKLQFQEKTQHAPNQSEPMTM